MEKWERKNLYKEFKRGKSIEVNIDYLWQTVVSVEKDTNGDWVVRTDEGGTFALVDIPWCHIQIY
jgi:hypothetical protein